MDTPMAAAGKTWRCLKCDGVLGTIAKRNGVTCLEIKDDSGTVAVMVGVGYVPCPLCGTERTWSASRETLDRLIEHYARR
jgi:hypothetical protein